MKRWWCVILPLFFGACALIDDDLSVCGEELVIDYTVQLSTELSVQLETELATETQGSIREGLRKWLEPIFTDRAKDVDLRFFKGETDNIEYQIKEVIDSTRTSYTIKLPKENYMHLAVANIADNRQVHLSDGEHSTTMRLSMPNPQEVDPLNTGIFTARLPMEVNDSTQHFDVTMYMVTCAVALIIDTTECTDLRGMDGYMSGSATGFEIRDSLFTYNTPCKLWLDRVMPENESAHMPSSRRVALQTESPLACMATVGLPTPDDQEWSLSVTATLTDNRHTTTKLTVEEPLKAGTLRIITCAMNAKGELDPNPDRESNQEVGATVTLDWKEGDEHEIDL